MKSVMIAFCSAFLFLPVLFAAELQISFPYVRQNGIASNQFAVLIENENGTFLKTLYVTSYTAKGGYAVRKDCVPTWVKRSGIAKKSSAEIDAITGATPRSGDLKYTWNCTGADGKPVPPGKYKFFVEGTNRWENRVIYSGTIEIGKGKAVAKAVPSYSSNSARRSSMIKAVTAVYTP